MKKTVVAGLVAGGVLMGGATVPAHADNSYGPYTASTPGGYFYTTGQDLDAIESVRVKETASDWRVTLTPELRFLDYSLGGSNGDDQLSISLEAANPDDTYKGIPGEPHLSGVHVSAGYRAPLYATVWQEATRANGYKDAIYCDWSGTTEEQASMEQTFGTPDTTGRAVTSVTFIVPKSCLPGDFRLYSVQAGHYRLGSYAWDESQYTYLDSPKALLKPPPPKAAPVPVPAPAPTTTPIAKPTKACVAAKKAVKRLHGKKKAKAKRTVKRYCR